MILNSACPVAIGPFWAVDAILLGVGDVGFFAWNFLRRFPFGFVEALPPAWAEIPPPEGWSQDIRNEGMMMTSPPNENGDRAIYFMLRPEPITIGDPDRPDIKTGWSSIPKRLPASSDG